MSDRDINTTMNKKWPNATECKLLADDEVMVQNEQLLENFVLCLWLIQMCYKDYL